jgi:pimeloyl-ACP methyl ester carboxylesterase
MLRLQLTQLSVKDAILAAHRDKICGARLAVNRLRGAVSAADLAERAPVEAHRMGFTRVLFSRIQRGIWFACSAFAGADEELAQRMFSVGLANPQARSTDWSPGYDGREDIAHVLRALQGPGRRRAALRYYRNNLQRGLKDTFAIAPKAPVLYLHGAQDGCMQAAIAEAVPGTLPAGSRYERVEGVGHFMQREDPPRVNALITEWVGAPR